MARRPPSEPQRQPPATILSGRTLSSTDFGAQTDALRPEIPGLALPPPTEMIRIPERILEVPEPPSPAVRAHRLLAPRLTRARELLREELYPALASGTARLWSQLAPILARLGPALSEAGEQHLRPGLARLKALLGPSEGAPSPTRADTSAEGERRLTRKATCIRAKPAVMAPPLVELAAGEEVRVLAGEDVPPGWALARAGSGELGFVPQEHLEPAPPT